MFIQTRAFLLRENSKWSQRQNTCCQFKKQTIPAATQDLLKCKMLEFTVYKMYINIKCPDLLYKKSKEFFLVVYSYMIG